MQNTLPGWLLHRARALKAERAWVILAPASERSSAIYLLQSGPAFEVHVVDDASNGIDGVTIPMTSREAQTLLVNLAGSLSGRVEGVMLEDGIVAEQHRLTNELARDTSIATSGLTAR